ncbi:MAG TPA: PilZ domain-containing protein [Planctomycetota bacterium]|nr:PilZ domain-containing protein [Planctomycetota bacterium]
MESETGSQRARDRRRHPRFADDANALCITETGGGGFHQARLTDISSDGMRIVSPCAFTPGSQLYAGVFLEDAREAIVLLGVVQHCETEGGDASLGIQFLSVADDQRAALQQLQRYLSCRHGAAATVTVRSAPAILRVGQERWW